MDYDETRRIALLIAEAYYRGRDYGESRAKSDAESATYSGSNWWTCAESLNEMGYTLTGGTGFSGRQMTIETILRSAEQLAENVKTTLEAEKGKPEATQNKRTIRFFTYALHLLAGWEEFEQRGLVEKLKDAAPSA